MVAACCGRLRDYGVDVWRPCTGIGVTGCSTREAVATVRHVKNGAELTKGEFVSFEKNGGGKYVLCGNCSRFVIMAHLGPKLNEATGKNAMRASTFINDVLMITGTKDKRQIKVPGDAAGLFLEAGRLDKEEEETESMSDDGDPASPDAPRRNPRRVSTLADAPAASAVCPEDPLDELWPMARPLIPRNCFTHSVLVTMFRVLLINDGYIGVGKTAFDDHVEGQFVLRFFARLYPAISCTVFDELIGKPTPKGSKWDVREKNLIFIPRPRCLRTYMGSPYSIVSVITISSEVIMDVIKIFSKLGLRSLCLAVNFDKVHVTNKHCEVIQDWPTSDSLRKEPFVVGFKTMDDLSGARRSYAELANKSEIPENELADGVETVVLSDLENKLPRGLLVAGLPIGAENQTLIRNIVGRIRQEVLKAGMYVVYAGGDGAGPNIKALKSLPRACTSTTRVR